MPGGASGFELAKTIKKDPRFVGKTSHDHDRA